MKGIAAIVVGVVFGFLVVAPVFAQGGNAQMQLNVAKELAKGRSGNFKGTVVRCDVDANTCIVKTGSGDRTGDMTYAQYNGGFNAAKELQPGMKVSGQWQEFKGKIYATLIVAD